MNLQVGNYIPESLSEYLKEYSTKQDRIRVFTETGVGDELLKKIIYQDRKITEDNREALIKLIQIAVSNAEVRIKESRNCKRSLTKILNTI